MYEKLAHMKSMTYPSYVPTTVGRKLQNRMSPPLVGLRIGELFGNNSYNQKGIIESLSVLYPDNSPWETETGKRVPRHIEVTVAYTILHETPPEMNSPSEYWTGFNQKNGNQFWAQQKKMMQANKRGADYAYNVPMAGEMQDIYGLHPGDDGDPLNNIKYSGTP